MIRDPSDGSVRETPTSTSAAVREFVDSTPRPPASAAMGLSAGVDTGLRQPTRTDAQQRLDQSREWLKNYHARKSA